jgi:hypothetical protein
MATSFPEEIDSFVNPTKYDNHENVSVPHWQQHADANDAITAIETALGATNSATPGESVKVQGGKLFALYEDGQWYQILFPTVNGERSIAPADDPE